MHDEGMLRAYIDAELGSEQRLALEEHLAACAACQARLADLHAQAGWIAGRLSSLAPAASEVPPPTAMLGRFRQRVAADARRDEPSWETAGSFTGRLNHMRRQWISGRWQPAAIGVLALVLVASLFTLEPVRVAAGQFLGIFRVRKFAALSLSPAQVQNLQASLKGVDGVLFGEPEMLRKPGPERAVESPGEASALAGFTVRLPQNVPGNPGEPKLAYQPGGAARFKIDAARIQAVLDAAGRQDLKLPPGIDGAVIDVDVPASVHASYGAAGNLTLIEMPSPTVTLPPGVNLGQLAEIGLQVIGMTPQEANQVSQRIDWANTLVIPVPTDVASFREVTVDGVDGLLLSSQRGARYAQETVLWEKDGIVYALSGRSDPETILRTANSMQ